MKDLYIFLDKYDSFRKILNNFFEIKEYNYEPRIHNGNTKWEFIEYPQKYKKYRRLLAYSKPYTPHHSSYYFNIYCKKIDLNNQFDKDFIEMVKKCETQINNTEENKDLKILDGEFDGNYANSMELDTISNKSFLNVKFIFQLFHFNWKYFYFIEKKNSNNKNNYNTNFELVKYDSTTLCNLSKDELDEKYKNLIDPDVEIIEEFISHNKPMYMFMMPEDITTFKHAFKHTYGYYYGVEEVWAISDNYLYYIDCNLHYNDNSDEHLF